MGEFQPTRNGEPPFYSTATYNPNEVADAMSSKDEEHLAAVNQFLSILMEKNPQGFIGLCEEVQNLDEQRFYDLLHASGDDEEYSVGVEGAKILSMIYNYGIQKEVYDRTIPEVMNFADLDQIPARMILETSWSRFATKLAGSTDDLLKKLGLDENATLHVNNTGLGSDMYGFVNYGKIQLLSTTEIDPRIKDVAKKVWKISNGKGEGVKFYLGDSRDLEELPDDLTVIYNDPPWGESSYEHTGIEVLGENVESTTREMFKKAKIVVYKAPVAINNNEVIELAKKLGAKVRIETHNLDMKNKVSSQKIIFLVREGVDVNNVLDQVEYSVDTFSWNNGKKVQG